MAGNKRKERISKIDKERRVYQVFKWITEGYTKRSFLFQLITESDLFDDISDRQKENYIAEAREMLKDRLSQDADFELDLALNRLESLYTMNNKINDFKECRMVVMDRAKLLGLVIEKQELQANIKNEKRETTDEQLSEIEKILYPD